MFSLKCGKTLYLKIERYKFESCNILNKKYSDDENVDMKDIKIFWVVMPILVRIPFRVQIQTFKD